MQELADVVVLRTQVLAEGMVELSAVNQTLMDRVAQLSSALNETVAQVQYLTGSERQIKANMDQAGWIDRYITDLGQRAERHNQRILRIEEGYERMNDAVRNVFCGASTKPQ